MDNVIKASGPHGLIGDLLRVDQPVAASAHLTMGAMADSYYEYLLKLWIQTGKSENKYKDQWKVAMRELEKMVGSTRSGLMFVGEIRTQGGKMSPKMEHLACFIAGNLKLGSETLPKDEVDPKWAVWAKGITEGCHAMYSRTETGLGPEYAMFRPDQDAPNDMYIEKAGQHYLLRPEVLESIYYMHYFTGDPKYREWTYAILQGLNKYARANWGYTAIKNVQSASLGSANWKDEEESFLFAETLKYIYLTLSPRKDRLDFSKWVFNTEAHPLPIVDHGAPFLA
jgi:mannosyl-oligosaccharide alpha-1,2-mannosidase